MTERLSTHTCWPKVLLYGFPPLGCLSDLLSQFILTKCGKNDGILLHRFSYKKTVISSLLDTCLPPSPISLSLCFSVSMWLYVSFYVCFKEASCHMARSSMEKPVWKGVGFPGGSAGKKSACLLINAGSISGSGRSPGEGNGNPLQYYCLGNPMDRRSLVDYSPWGCKRVGNNLVTKQQQYSIVCTCILFVYSCVNEHLGCFHFRVCE